MPSTLRHLSALMDDGTCVHYRLHTAPKRASTKDAGQKKVCGFDTLVNQIMRFSAINFLDSNFLNISRGKIIYCADLEKKVFVYCMDEQITFIQYFLRHYKVPWLAGFMSEIKMAVKKNNGLYKYRFTDLRACLNNKRSQNVEKLTIL